MENNLLVIIEEIHKTIDELKHGMCFKTVATEDLELEVLHHVANELIKDLGEIEQKDNVRKALVNMFIAGNILPKSKKNHD